MKELSLYHDYFGKKDFTSLYIGGGTPTLMVNEIEDILSHLHKYFNIAGEIALETSPEEINKEILTKLKYLGVNLISIGKLP